MKHEAAVQTVKEVQGFWEKALNPTGPFQQAVKKREDLIGKCEALKKNNKGRRSKTEQENEDEFNGILTIFLTSLVKTH